MPEYLAPGVYVEEVDRGPVPIEGVSTSTAGFVGVTARGPTKGRPRLVTNFRQFEETFGGYFPFPFAGHNRLPFAVEGFFANGGQRVYISRVVPAGAARAGTQPDGGLTARLAENTVEGASVITLASLKGIEANKTSVTLVMVKDGQVSRSGPHAVTGINRNTRVASLGSALPTNVAFDRTLTAVATNVQNLTATGILATAAPRAATFRIEARDEGAWGNEVVIESEHDPIPAGRAELDSFLALPAGTTNETLLRLRSTAGFYPGAWVEIDTTTSKIYRPVLEVAGLNIRLGLQALAATDVNPPAGQTTVITTCELRLTVTRGETSEDFSGLTLVNVPGRYYADRLKASRLISVTELAPRVEPGSNDAKTTTNSNPFQFPIAQERLQITLTAGADATAAPTEAQYRGTDGGPGNRTGIRALEDVDEISIIAAPGEARQSVQQALIEQCQALKDRFAILDPVVPAGASANPLDEIQTQRNRYDTRYAALYFPRVTMDDPLTPDETPVAIPPSGHVAGVYARTDVTRGVHKAPANELLNGIAGYEFTVTKREQDILNPSPRNINVLRDFRADARGLRVYGGRVITSDSAWRYVNVRRLFIFLEESLDEGLQFVVFEPNAEPLWARVVQSVSIFLTRVWRDGALMGTTPEQAFFVRCDRTTMTEDDIVNGRLILEVGAAPVRPAEFVVIRIMQKTLEAEA